MVRCFRWRVVGWGRDCILYGDRDHRVNPTPGPVIRRRGVSLVKVHNDCCIAYDPLLYII